MDTEDDALLAPASAPASEVESVDDEDIVEDGSTSDSQGIVRVWVSEGRITRVRVSPQWHARLGRRSLADCFTQALLMAQMTVAEVHPAQVNHHDDVDFSRGWKVHRLGPSVPTCCVRRRAPMRNSSPSSTSVVNSMTSRRSTSSCSLHSGQC